MNVEQIKAILTQLDQLRQAAKGKSHEERVRLLMCRQRLRRKLYASDGEFDGVATEALIHEANEIYKRAIGDRLTESALTVRDRILWGEINRRRAARSAL
jgi:hypothetical protein